MDTVFAVQAVMGLVDHITRPLRAIRGGMADTERNAGSLSGSMAGLTKTLLPLAAAAGIFLAALAPGIGVAADFEQSISQVAAVSRATQQEIVMLEQAALDLGASTAWSATQVAQAEKYLAMAGFRARENIEALPAVLNLASAGATDLARSADIASDILSGFGLVAADMPRVADVLTATFTTANTSLEMLGDTMKYVAPVAKGAGLSLEATSAMAGMLGNIGIKASMSGTALRTMLSSLAAPTSEASGMLRNLGVEAVDASGNLRNPVQILGELSTAMNSMGSGKQLNILDTLFGREAMAGAADLIEKAGMGDLTSYIDVIENSVGTSSAVANKQLDNMNGAVTLLGSAWEGLQISIGKIFLPVLTPLILGISTVVGWLNALAQSAIGKFFIGLSAVMAVAVLGLTAFTAAGAGMAFVLPYLKAGLVAFMGLISMISWPVWGAIGAIVALSAAFKSNFLGITDIATKWWNNIVLVVGGVKTALSSLQNGIGIITGAQADLIKSAGLEGVVSKISQVIYRMWSVYDGFWQALKFYVSEVSGIFLPVWQSVVDAFSPLLPVFKSMGQSIVGVARALGVFTAQTDVSGWRLFGEVIGSVVGSAFQALAYTLRIVLTLVQMLMGFIGGLTRGFVAIGNLIGTLNWSDMGAKLMSTFAAGIRSKILSPLAAVKTGMAKIREFFPGSDAKTGPLSTITASGAALFDTFATGIQGTSSNLLGSVKRIIAPVAAAMAITVPAITGPGMVTYDDVQPALEIASGTKNKSIFNNFDQPTPFSGKSKPKSMAARNQTIIQIENLNLPNVKDAEGFVKDLQKLVEAYDA